MRPQRRSVRDGAKDGLDQLKRQWRRHQEHHQWKYLREHEPAPVSGRPRPTDEANRIRYEEPNLKPVMRLMCAGPAHEGRTRPMIGSVVAVAGYGLLLVGAYDGPDPRGTAASGSMRRFRTGMWLDEPRAFAARCGRCGQVFADASGGLIAEVRDALGKRRGNLVIDSRYAVPTTDTPGL